MSPGALAVTLIFQAGDANTLEVFGTGFADVEGFAGPMTVSKFPGGQSNPTILVESGSQRWVVPGLMDMHAHLIGDDQTAELGGALFSTAARDAFRGVKNARTTLNKVISTYPESEAAKQAQVKLGNMNAEGR